MSKIVLHENERLDDLNHLGRQIIQRTDAFCFGMDAVLLAHFPKYGARCRVLDLGTGTGVIPLLMAEEADTVDALELDAEMAERAARSVEYNGLEEKIRVKQGDYREIKGLYPAES
ncbi:MAG: methyltransferase domain-containing protein, partial [Schwartzia sp.]|nr:methyltransferase domain-containing protein [Schwartzia sp. (in: firmicutes)]